MHVHHNALIAAVIGMASGVACEKTTTEHRLDGPMRLALGDCAVNSTKYVSGHKPEPFVLSELEQGKVGSPHRSSGRSGADADTSPDERPDQPADLRSDERPDDEASEPTLTVGEGAARGGLDEGVIRAAIEGEAQRFLGCYERALTKDAELAGTVVVSFTINRRGKVAEAAAVGVSPGVAACVQKAFKSVRFERPGSDVKARFPLRFRPGEAVARPPDPAPAQPENEVSDARPDTGADAGAGVAKAAAAGAAKARAAARAVLDNPPGYQPGAGNQLREYRAQLIECFRTKVPKKRPYGSLVVDLVKYQGAHAVVGVTSDTGNNTLEECVRDAIGAASEAVAKGAPVERCPLAFGSTPLDEAEGIDITEDRVLAGRRMRAMVADITSDTAGARGLKELKSWAEKLAKKRARLTHKSLADDQPVVIRPLGDTPVIVVRRVLETATAAGLDTVLTVHRGDAWQPVHGFALPGTPVPRGSGQGYSIDRHAGKHREAGRPQIVPSLLVGTSDVWIGVSRIDDFRRFTARDQALDLEVFQRGLKDVKLMSHFADRRDIEIAAADDVSYDTLVTFIDYAVAAGFTEWTLMAPEQLSARPPGFR